jgi:hypothetical protein
LLTRSPRSTVLHVPTGEFRKGQGFKKELKSLSSRSKKELGCNFSLLDYIYLCSLRSTFSCVFYRVGLRSSLLAEENQER